MDTVARYAERFGVYDRLQPFLANALGSQETTLFKMVAAYAMFANGGERVEPTLVDRVQDRWGKTIYRHDQRTCPECEQPSLPAGRRAAHRVEPRAGDGPDHRLPADLDDAGRGGSRHGLGYGEPAGSDRGQDRHHQRRARCLVRGLFQHHRGGLLHRLRQSAPAGQRRLGWRACAGRCSTSSCKRRSREYGGGPFEVPEGGRFIKIDRFTGARGPTGPAGENVVAEYFRDGEEPLFGLDL